MATASVNLPLVQPTFGAPSVLRRRPRVWQLLLRNRMAVVGATLVLGWVVLALLAPLLAPYDPIDQQVRARLQGPSAAHGLGVDELGRDVLSRVLYGGRLSLPVAAVVECAWYGKMKSLNQPGIRRELNQQQLLVTTASILRNM